MFNSPKQPLIEMIAENRFLDTLRYKYWPKLLQWLVTISGVLSPVSAFLFLSPLSLPVSIMQGPYTVGAVSISVVAMFISVLLSVVLLYGNHTARSWMLLPYITVHFAASVFGMFTKAWLSNVYFRVALVFNLISLLVILTQFLLMTKLQSDQKNYNIIEGIITKYYNHKAFKTISIVISLVASVSAFLFLCPGSAIREPLPYLGQPHSAASLTVSVVALIGYVVLALLLIIGSLKDSPLMMLIYCVSHFLASVFGLAMIVWNYSLYFNIAVTLNLFSLTHVTIHIVNICVTKTDQINRVVSKISIILLILVNICGTMACIFTIMVANGYFKGYHVQKYSDSTEPWRRSHWGRRTIWARGDTRIRME